MGVSICLLFVTAAVLSITSAEYVDYSGHQVFTIKPSCEDDLTLLKNLQSNYGIDLWNEPKITGVPVMVRVKPEFLKPFKDLLESKHISFETSISDLGSVIMAEKVQNAPTGVLQRATFFDFGKYHQYSEIVSFITSIASDHPKIALLETIGYSYENRPIHSVKISAGSSVNKPVIIMECGIHAREWSSVAAGVYIVNKLITEYGSDPIITTLVDHYEFHIIPEANPDGYIFTWQQDRLWRKTRSRSDLDWMGNCRGADANRNFDIDHCGVGTSRKPCEEIYCGDKPFSESESRALRDIMVRYKDRIKVYFSIHAFSQLWMTPYGTSKNLPPNYSDLYHIGHAGAEALRSRYGTVYRVGSIANIIYEATGSSIDFAYQKLNITTAFALELRDTGRYGFFLPKELILPTVTETWDGLQGAILALR